jgi:hypothetical protein
MRLLRVLLAAAAVFALSAVVFAQGPTPALIQQAIRALLAGPATITGTWTCAGTCTGFGGGGGGVTSLTGTANQVLASASTGAVTLSTPQSIATTSTPQFARLGLGTAADSAAVAKFAGQYYSPLVDDGNSGTADTIDWNAGNEHLSTLTGNVTYTLSNPVDGGRYVILIATGAGSFSATWPGTVAWPGGVAPTITAAAGKVDVITLIYRAGASTYYAAFSQNY